MFGEWVPYYLSPLAEQRHKASTNVHGKETYDLVDERCVEEACVVVDLVGNQRNKGVVKQDTSCQRIKNSLCEH